MLDAAREAMSFAAGRSREELERDRCSSSRSSRTSRSSARQPRGPRLGCRQHTPRSPGRGALGRASLLGARHARRSHRRGPRRPAGAGGRRRHALGKPGSQPAARHRRDLRRAAGAVGAGRRGCRLPRRPAARPARRPPTEGLLGIGRADRVWALWLYAPGVSDRPRRLAMVRLRGAPFCARVLLTTIGVAHAEDLRVTVWPT